MYRKLLVSLYLKNGVFILILLKHRSMRVQTLKNFIFSYNYAINILEKCFGNEANCVTPMESSSPLGRASSKKVKSSNERRNKEVNWMFKFHILFKTKKNYETKVSILILHCVGELLIIVLCFCLIFICFFRKNFIASRILHNFCLLSASSGPALARKFSV